MAAVAVLPVAQESAAELARRLAGLIECSEQHSMPDAVRDLVAVLLDTLRLRVVRKLERDHRSLFELDDRLIELMGQVEEAAEAGTEISAELAEDIDTYLEAHRRKVDRIVGYWRCQQLIADISGKEAERLYPRKRAAEVADSKMPEDDAPSCSALAALERQEPFVNGVLAHHALALLAQLFRHGRLDHHGAFVDVAANRAQPIPIDTAVAPISALEPSPRRGNHACNAKKCLSLDIQRHARVSCEMSLARP